jgi:hypothetical protein
MITWDAYFLEKHRKNYTPYQQLKTEGKQVYQDTSSH